MQHVLYGPWEDNTRDMVDVIFSVTNGAIIFAVATDDNDKTIFYVFSTDADGLPNETIHEGNNFHDAMLLIGKTMEETD